MSELLPCPFCGGEAMTNETAGIPKENLPSGWGWVGCQHCRVFMTYCHGERGKKKRLKRGTGGTRRGDMCQIPDDFLVAFSKILHSVSLFLPKYGMMLSVPVAPLSALIS